MQATCESCSLCKPRKVQNITEPNQKAWTSVETSTFEIFGMCKNEKKSVGAAGRAQKNQGLV